MTQRDSDNLTLYGFLPLLTQNNSLLTTRVMLSTVVMLDSITQPTDVGNINYTFSYSYPHLKDEGPQVLNALSY